MSEPTPKAAVNTFLTRFSDALHCIADFHAFATVYSVGPGSIFLKPHQRSGMGKGASAIPLVGQSGRIDFYLDVALQYEAIGTEASSGPFTCRTSAYSYLLHDLDEREILAFQWSPYVDGPFRFPHLHISVAGDITARDGRSIQREFNIGNFHIPTGLLLIDDVVELLIREFRIDPKRRDWLDTLNRNRAAVQQSTLWGAHPSPE